MLFLLHADAFFIRMTYTYILLYTQNGLTQHILLDSYLNKSFEHGFEMLPFLLLFCIH